MTSGGRVLAVTGIGSTLRLALLRAYAGMSQIHFDGMQVRTDIGQQQAGRQPPVRIAILGSTRGSSVRPLIEEQQQRQGKEKGNASYEIVMVMSNQEDAGLLSYAREKGVPTRYIGGGGRGSQQQQETEIMTTMEEAGAEILLLNGYNRILSSTFVNNTRGRCLNLHPSLLPDFASVFDRAVHQAVLDAKRQETGCTVHLVTEEVDQGPPLLQLHCPVHLGDDTVDDVRARVQAIEPQAWRKAIDFYRYELPTVAKAILACGPPPSS